MDRECVPAVPKPRKRRTESGVGVESEQGISLLEFAGPSSADPSPRFDPTRLKHTDERERHSLLGRHDLFHVDSKSFAQVFRQGLGSIAALEELLHGVDFNFLSSSFAIFRQMSSHFPFVELSPGADVMSMVAHRPIFALAICTVASASHPQTQARLDQAFQYALSSKIFLGHDASNMDVLTGLLVYLAWNHHYMSQPQLYQRLHLLSGLAADLGLYLPKLRPLDPPYAQERDRAFVGCYYLCSMLSPVAFDRPNPCRWTVNLRVCAENATRTGNLHSDRSLVAFVELAHCMDEMEESIRHDIVSQYSNPTQYVELQLRASSQRLKTLKREHPALVGLLGFEAANIHIYQRLLRLGEVPESPVLIQGACAIKEYLEDVLSRPPETLHQIGIVDWANLLEILVLTAQMSKPSTTASSWEAGALTSMLQADAMLDAIITRANSAPSNDPLTPRHDGLLHWLRSICDTLRHLLATAQNNSDGRFRSATEAQAVVGGNFDISRSHGIGVLDPGFINHLAGA